MKKLRVFVSSPGDVYIERNITRKIISELNSLYAEHLKIEVLMWEDFPLSADMTFQEGIDYFLTDEHIDLAVFILWSRLGTPLSNKFLKEDGTSYNSGTEYEFDLMMRLHKECGYPRRILTYVKQDDSYPTNCNWTELRELLSQKEVLECFLRENFRDEETNSNYAYLTFGKTFSFEELFKTHLINAIKEQIGEVSDVKEWEGNPYVGLKSFEYNDAPIFCGRRQLVYETASKLSSLDEDTTIKNLIVLGESGSGKSSFVKAGLLPFLCNIKHGAYDYVMITPSEYGSELYRGLLGIIQNQFKFLSGFPFMEDLYQNITEQTNFKYLSHELKDKSVKGLLIYIDQFEELFIDNRISEEERIKVLRLLKGLVSTCKISVFITMRSDFYNKFFIYKDMSQIKEKCEILDLPVMGVSEITEIVEIPAKKACLSWDVDPTGVSLNHLIINDAIAIKELPLIEFALYELYESRDDNDVLTLDTYIGMGGLKGAVINYADKIYAQFSDDEKIALTEILGFVITESSSHKALYVRKISYRSDMENSSLHKSVIDKLLKARLFVAGRDSAGKATITIIHEILIKSWKVVKEWIEREKEFISKNLHYEQLAQHWVCENKDKKNLIQGRSLMLEAEYFHFKYKNRISALVKEYILQSLTPDRKKLIPFLKFLVTILTLGMVLISWQVYKNPTLQTTAILLITGALLLFTSYAIYRCRSRQLRYMVIMKDVAVYAVVGLMLLAGTYFMNDMNWIGYSFMIGFTFLTLMAELVKRLKWTKRHVGYLISDNLWRSLEMSLVILFVTFMAYSNIYKSECEETRNLEERIEQISQSEFSDMERKEYIENNYQNELNDENADETDLQYARVLYNLNAPQSALMFLDKNRNWRHHILEIMCQFAIGQYGKAENSLEEYIIEGPYFKIDNQLSTANLIWVAEVLGRFDIAQNLLKIVRQDCYDYNNEILLGHSYLHYGDIDNAVLNYNHALRLSGLMGNVDKNGNNNLRDKLQNDLHIFSRFESVPDEYLREIADRMCLEFEQAYIKKSDINISDTKLLLERLTGDWIATFDDHTIHFNFDPKTNVGTISKIDNVGNLLANGVIEWRAAIIDGEMYVDEFNPLHLVNTFAKIQEIEDDYFIIHLVDFKNRDNIGDSIRYDRKVVLDKH